MKKFNDQNRLRVLYDLELLDTTAEVELDLFVQSATNICEVPIALVSLVDKKRQWFKAKFGLDACETPREFAFCDHAIRQDKIYIVEDATKHELFKDNPLVTGGPKIVFYAGMPINISGENIGTICVIDTKPRQLSEIQKKFLEQLSKQISLHLQLRKKNITQSKISEMLSILGKIDFKDNKEITSTVEYYLKVGRELFDLEYGIQSRITGKKYFIESVISPNNELEAGIEFDLKDTYCEEVIKQRGFVSYQDVSKLDDMQGHPVYINMKLESYISTPIWVDGKIYGTLNFSSKKVRRTNFSDEEIHFLKILADIIGKKISYQNSTEYINYVLDIFNSAPEFIGMADAKTGKTLYHNKAFRDISGKQEFEFNIEDFHPVWAFSKISNEGIPAAMEKGTWTGETAIISKDGVEIPVLQTIIAHKDISGELLYISTIMQDITIQKEIEKDHIFAKREAIKASKLKTEFLANISHEIRTPLNGILGTVSLLKDTNVDHSQSEMIRTIQSCGKGLLSLLNDILDLSKIESGKLLLEKSEFNLDLILQESVDLFKSQAMTKNIDLKFQNSKQESYIVKGDATRLTQIVSNFLSNAIKFTPEGSILVKLNSKRMENKNCLFTISVIDSGIGIKKENQKKIFDSFLQADTSITRRFGGTGLGLSICLKLAKIMGGNIILKSEYSKGSTFTLSVPLEIVSSTDNENAKENLKEDLFDKKFSEKHPHNILIAEDNLLNQKLIKTFLEKLGYQCDIAHNGYEAIEKYKKHHYSLIFMDLQMPEVGGLEATKKILSLQTNKPLDIIALTANAFPEDKEKCYEAGMVDFIGKPFKVDDFKQTIKKISEKNFKLIS